MIFQVLGGDFWQVSHIELCSNEGDFIYLFIFELSKLSMQQVYFSSLLYKAESRDHNHEYSDGLVPPGLQQEVISPQLSFLFPYVFGVYVFFVAES